MSSFPSLFPAGFCAAVKCVPLSDSYLTCLSAIKSPHVSFFRFPLLLDILHKRKKSRLPLFERVHLICVLIAYLSLIYLPGKNQQTDTIPPLPENQHKYTRTFEMPKDSRTHRLLDNSLQATITPQSISPTPSLSVSLLNPFVCLPVCLPLKSPPIHPLRIVSAPASQAESRLI